MTKESHQVPYTQCPLFQPLSWPCLIVSKDSRLQNISNKSSLTFLLFPTSHLHCSKAPNAYTTIIMEYLLVNFQPPSSSPPTKVVYLRRQPAYLATVPWPSIEPYHIRHLSKLNQCKYFTLFSKNEDIPSSASVESLDNWHAFCFEIHYVPFLMFQSDLSSLL